MLKIWQGTYTRWDKKALDSPDDYFDDNFDKKNVLSEFSRRLIKDCAKADVIADNVFEHEWRGVHTIKELASGVKTILLAKYNPEVIVDISFCGDNCIPYLIEISRERDITVIGSRLVDFFDEDMYGDSAEGIYVMNDDTYYTDDLEYIFTGIYADDWNEETPEGLVLHPEYFKPLSQHIGDEELGRPKSSLSKYVKIVNDCAYPDM